MLMLMLVLVLVLVLVLGQKTEVRGQRSEERSEVRFGETSKPAREARALPKRRTIRIIRAIRG
jgi:hypothetical protein